MSWFGALLSEHPLHPMFVHFPIALFPTALLFQFLAAWRHKARFGEVAKWLLYLGTVGAIVAVATGFLEASELGHDSPGHEFVHVHRDFMVVTTVLAILVSTACWLVGKRRSARLQWGLTAAMVALVVVLAVGAEKGGSLVYQYGTGVRWETPPAGQGGHEHGETPTPSEEEHGGEHGH